MNIPDARALVVEDNPSWQQILAEILADAGLAIDVADSLETAVDSLRAFPHRLAVVDLALGDGDYDNQDGLRVLETIRRQDPGCVAIMLTGFATVELAVNVLTEHGAFTCLRKEAFDRAAFRELVDQALASAPPLEAEVPDMDGALSSALPDSSGGLRSASSASCGPGLALIVEDDAGWRSILSELLTDADYEVHLCRSYGEALGRLRREKYALAVVDLSLAGLDPWRAARPSARPESDLEGYQLLSTTHTNRVPTIVVSGVATPDEIKSAYVEHGIFAYVQKQTFNRRAFLQVVDEAQARYEIGSELDSLTEREHQVLELLAQGLTNKEIAQALVITTNTVKRHLKAIFRKLDVHTRSAAAAKAIGAGISTDLV